MKAVYDVQGMSCGGCVKSVEKAIAAKLPGVQADVSLSDGSVTVHGDHDASAVREAVEDAGFSFGGPRG